MYTMMLGCIKDGIVKSFFAEPFQEEAAYLKRYKIFQSMLYPTFVDYKRYQELIKPLSEKKVNFEAKTFEYSHLNYTKYPRLYSCKQKISLILC